LVRAADKFRLQVIWADGLGRWEGGWWLDDEALKLRWAGPVASSEVAIALLFRCFSSGGDAKICGVVPNLGEHFHQFSH
jgi:hypothetical protein